MPSSPRWLDIVRHRVRGIRAPYLLVLQHHDIPASTMLTAPVTLPLPGDADAVAPRLTIGDVVHRVRLLDIGAVPRPMLGEIIGSALSNASAVLGALDVILHGYPVGRPIN